MKNDKNKKTVSSWKNHFSLPGAPEPLTLLFVFLGEKKKSVAGKIDFCPPWGTGAIDVVIVVVCFFLRKKTFKR